LNYFSYFTEIEDTFIRRRGKHLMLSPIDWALIESWKERGVPLHVALRAIEHAFDSYESKKRKRSVKSLLYCQEEVEAQYAEWLESRIGSNEAPAEAEADATSTGFSRDVLLRHLNESLAALTRLRDARANDDELSEALSRATSLLTEIREDFSTTAHTDARKLEESLSGIDRLLDDAIRQNLTPEEFAAATDEVDAQIKPYKRQMDKAAFEQTRANLLRKRLRERFDVPRLSLFYL
jgi:hypothetical protein